MATELFLFNIVDKLLGKLGSHVYQEVCLAWGVKTDLKKLEEILSTVKAVLLDAEEKQANNHELRVWLGKLKDAMNDAEDVVDEFECEALRRQVVKTHGSVTRKVRRFFSHSSPLVFRFEIGHAIKQVRERLYEIASHRTQFHLSERLLEDRSVVHRKMEMTYSFVKASDVIGRDSEKEEIVASLFWADDDGNVSVIPIVGIGGLGKTTLAKLVFNDERVVKSFQLKIWVCVCEDFDLKQLIVKIIKSATGENYNDFDLEQMQIHLRRTLNGTKFLFVLDDVWNEDRGKWIELRDLLMEGGANGSKIIVTTRSPIVASIMGTIRAYDLQGLSHEDCMSLFLKWAFDEGEEKRHADLVKIGDAIVKKCKGIPLAVRTLGSLLYSKTDQSDWLLVRDSEIWELYSKQKETDILPALQLSYNQMPSYLKQCFAYFSLFPKDFEYDNFELIQLWMAHGLLQSISENQELEDVGNQYIYELFSRSFLQDYCDLGNTRFFKIHDLTHDLALLIAQSEFLVVNSPTQNVPKKVRHLSFLEPTWKEQDVLELLQKSKRVRTISLRIKGETTISNILLDSCISRFKYLRVLNLNDSSFEMLPNSISNLKHLRSLNLARNRKIKKIPNSICKLQNLHSLELGECEELQELPKDIRNMISLRCFVVTTKQTCLPENGVGCLSSLQILSFEKCGNLVSLFEGMQRLTSLRTLRISHCGNLTSLPRGMKYLSALKVLMIRTCEKLDLMDSEDNQDLQLNLQTVLFGGLPKFVSLPQWLQRSANTLQHLGIRDCPNFEALPDWLPNLTSLKKFGITNCQKLSSLPMGMHCLTSLRLLYLKDCPGLSTRCKPKSGEDWSKIAHVPDIYIDGENVKSTAWARSGDREEVVSRRNIHSAYWRS